MLTRKTVKAIDKSRLERTLGPVDLAGVTVIATDEFAIHKGHRYATVVVVPFGKRALWVGRGRDADAVAAVGVGDSRGEPRVIRHIDPMAESGSAR